MKKSSTEVLPPCQNNTKVAHSSKSSKDIVRVYEYFRYTTGTTLDCAKATGILRNSITWYVAELEKEDLLQVVGISRDATTHRRAKHYSAGSSKRTVGFGKEARHG